MDAWRTMSASLLEQDRESVHPRCLFGANPRLPSLRSPVNSSAKELKHAIGLPILHNMVRQAVHRDGNSYRAQAKREVVVEEGAGGFGAEARRRKEGAEPEDTVRRWTVARKKMKKAEEDNRDRRRKRVEEIVREKERMQKAGRKLSAA